MSPAVPSQSSVQRDKHQTVLLSLPLVVEIHKDKMVVLRLQLAQSPNSVLHDRNEVVLAELFKKNKKKLFYTF